MRRAPRSKKTPPKRGSSGGENRINSSGATSSAAVAQPAIESVSAPSWFSWALSEPYETIRVRIDDPEEPVDIHCLRFGASSSKQGLVFVHGGGANAHWYRFIAPFFASEYDVVAITNSGNCDSSSREKGYSMDKWSSEIIQCCNKLGLLAPGRPKPYIVAHSLGTYVVTNMLARAFPEAATQFAGVILADGAIRSYKLARTVHERVMDIRAKDPTLKPRSGWNVNPPTLSPLARFKLRPYQECDNIYIVSACISPLRELSTDPAYRSSFSLTPCVRSWMTREAGAGRATATGTASLIGTKCPFSAMKMCVR
jgi:pimeloyl-ACP methyl ester carboxylesterase